MKFDKLNKLILGLVVVLTLSASTAMASLGFDTYAAVRTVVLAPANVITNNIKTFTNGPIDLLRYIGTAKIDFMTGTNSQGFITGTLYGSNDTTNWVTLPNYSLATLTADCTTNYQVLYNPTNGLAITNYTLVPGTYTVPSSVALGGYATPYTVPAPFTNTGAFTLSSTNYAVQIGIRGEDAPRYLMFQGITGGTATNVNFSALLTAVPWNPVP